MAGGLGRDAEARGFGVEARGQRIEIARGVDADVRHVLGRDDLSAGADSIWPRHSGATDFAAISSPGTVGSCGGKRLSCSVRAMRARSE